MTSRFASVSIYSIYSYSSHFPFFLVRVSYTIESYSSLLEDPPISNSPINSTNDSPILFGAFPDPSEGRQMSQSTKEAFPGKPEERAASNESASWPALPDSSKTPTSIPSCSPIPPGQKPTESATPASWKVLQKSPEEYDRDMVCKYAPYFQGNIILPIPEISKPRKFPRFNVDDNERDNAGVQGLPGKASLVV